VIQAGVIVAHGSPPRGSADLTDVAGVAIVCVVAVWRRPWEVSRGTPARCDEALEGLVEVAG